MTDETKLLGSLVAIACVCGRLGVDMPNFWRWPEHPQMAHHSAQPAHVFETHQDRQETSPVPVVRSYYDVSSYDVNAHYS